jgi:hypothetical protein
LAVVAGELALQQVLLAVKVHLEAGEVVAVVEQVVLELLGLVVLVVLDLLEFLAGKR